MATNALERDPGPAARFEACKADKGFSEDIFRLLTGEEPKSLTEIARIYRVPKGEFTRWYLAEHGELYDAALKVATDEMIFAAKKLLDGATEETVATVKVKVDGYMKLAAKWDRQRYGESVRVDRTVTFAADAGLMGVAGALLQLVRTRPVALPAPTEPMWGDIVAPEQVTPALSGPDSPSAPPPARVVAQGDELVI